jgi:isopentenyl diphosphate isomerase/L-lactate dehydrogenase-like FMN-dependent dehydrogenase
MFLVGAENLDDLRSVRYTITGRLRDELSA